MTELKQWGYHQPVPNAIDGERAQNMEQLAVELWRRSLARGGGVPAGEPEATLHTADSPQYWTDETGQSVMLPLRHWRVVGPYVEGPAAPPGPVVTISDTVEPSV